MKATTTPQKLMAATVWQLVGYALLDYDDEYGIDQVGWYLARTGWLVTWPLPEMLRLLGARKPLPALRAKLQAVLTGWTPTRVCFHRKHTGQVVLSRGLAGRSAPAGCRRGRPHRLEPSILQATESGIHAQILTGLFGFGGPLDVHTLDRPPPAPTPQGEAHQVGAQS